MLAVVPLPSAAERRRREIMLPRVMLVSIDIVLSGEPLGLETARVQFAPSFTSEASAGAGLGSFSVAKKQGYKFR